MCLIPRRFFRLAPSFVSLHGFWSAVWAMYQKWMSVIISKAWIGLIFHLKVGLDTGNRTWHWSWYASTFVPIRFTEFCLWDHMWLRRVWNTFIVNTWEESAYNIFGMTGLWLEYQGSNISELFSAVMENLSSFKGVLINYSWRRKALAYNLLFVPKTGSKVH